MFDVRCLILSHLISNIEHPTSSGDGGNRARITSRRLVGFQFFVVGPVGSMPERQTCLGSLG